MNTRLSPGIINALAFGFGLTFLQPFIPLAIGLILASLWSGYHLTRLGRKHWPGLNFFIPLAGDFLVILLVISLLFGLLWLLPTIPPQV